MRGRTSKLSTTPAKFTESRGRRDGARVRRRGGANALREHQQIVGEPDDRRLSSPWSWPDRAHGRHRSSSSSSVTLRRGSRAENRVALFGVGRVDAASS